MGPGLKASVVSQIVADGLAPFVGASMARASVNGHLDKLDVQGGLVTTDQLDTLLGRIGPGLSVFVGPARGAEVIEKIRGELRGAGYEG